MDPQTQPPTNQPPIIQQTTQVPPPQQNSKLSLIIVGLVLVIILGGVNYYFGKRSAKTNIQTNQPGTITGKLCYPSDFLPKGEIVAKDLSSGKLHTQDYPGCGAGGCENFNFQLPPGKYHLRYQAHASGTKPDVFISGYYTLNDKIISIDVISGKSVTGVALCDFSDTVELNDVF